MATWLEDVVKAFNEIGGKGDYITIYKKVKEIRRNSLPASWQSIIRYTIETNSSDSDAYLRKNDLFYTVHGKGSGVWGLRNYKKESYKG